MCAFNNKKLDKWNKYFDDLVEFSECCTNCKGELVKGNAVFDCNFIYGFCCSDCYDEYRQKNPNFDKPISHYKDSKENRGE
jgi:hypothetical protein